MEFNFAAVNNEPESQKGLSEELATILGEHLKEKDNISSIDKTLTTRVYEKNGINAFYIQSNIPGSHINLNAGGDVHKCSAIIHLFGLYSPLFESLAKNLEKAAGYFKPQ